MQDQDDALNIKVIMLGVGGAALAALLVALARHKDEKSAEERVEAAKERAEEVVVEAMSEAKQAAKTAKKKRKEMAAAAKATRQQLAGDVREAAAKLELDAMAAERDLKAAAWDAQQEAIEAEGRLRAAGHRVVDDATSLASWVGAEARNLAGGGREKIAHLRHRDENAESADDELQRLRAEVEELKEQLGRSGRRFERDYRGLASRFAGKSGPIAELMASQVTSATLDQLERSLRTKAPALLAARSRAQAMDILQKELGPTLRDTVVQAAIAALGKLESDRPASDAADLVRERTRQAAVEARDIARELGEAARERVGHAAGEAKGQTESVAHEVESIQSNGKRRLWRSTSETSKAVEDAVDATEKEAEAATEATEEEHRSKAGLFWSGAGIGLVLYALLDEERRDKVLRFANEASVQVQELVRDLQGYDDEF